jgi:hypothetical protein
MRFSHPVVFTSSITPALATRGCPRQRTRGCPRQRTKVSQCSYIHKKTGGVHDYLCNKLFQLPEEAIEGILLQLCELAVNQPVSSDALKKSLIQMCTHSERLALKVRLHALQ